MRYIGSLGASISALGLILCSIALLNSEHRNWGFLLACLALVALFGALWQFNQARFHNHARLR